MKSKEVILEKRIIQFPSSKQMPDASIKKEVYAAMQEYADQEVSEYKEKLKRITEVLPTSDDYDPGQVIFEIEEILFGI